MLLNEHSVRALDSDRRERLVQERAEGGLFGRSALAVVVAGIILAACGAPLPVAVPGISKPIVDLAPVGSPSISAVRGYEVPEMRPETVGQTVEIDGYETPEMWPVAAQREYVVLSTGPR